MLLDAISVLNDEEQYIMISRYGLNGMKVKTQKQLANELNMSQANISKIQRSCLKRLRFNLQKKSKSLMEVYYDKRNTLFILWFTKTKFN